MEVDEDTAFLTAKLTAAFGILNLLAYSILFVLIFRLRKYQTRSHRLLIYMFSGAVLQGIGALIYFKWLRSRLGSEAWCSAAGFFYNWSDVCYSFWAIVICVYIMSKGIFERDHRLFELIGGFYAYGLSLVISLDGLSSLTVIYGPIDNVWCWISDEFNSQRTTQHHIWVWLSFFFVFGSLVGIIIKWYLLHRTKFQDPISFQNLSIGAIEFLPYIGGYCVCYLPRLAGWLEIIFNGGRWNYVYYNFSAALVLCTGPVNLGIFVIKWRHELKRIHRNQEVSMSDGRELKYMFE